MAAPKVSKVPAISFSDGLAIFSIVLTVVLLVLDKAGKLRGPVLFVLLAVAFAMLIPLAVGNAWVSGSHGIVRVFRAVLLCCAIVAIYSALSLWISPDDVTPVGTPNPAVPTPKLVTLKELFENDWPNLPAYYNVSTMEVSSPRDNKVVLKVTVAWRLNGDFVARSKFLAFFIEPTTSAGDAVWACRAIADRYRDFIDSANSQVDISGQTPDDTSATSMRDMVFSKRVFIYYENPDFSLAQKGSIETLYKSKGLSVQFRDNAYAWAHRDDHAAFRPEPLVPNSTLLPDAHANPGMIIKVVNLGPNEQSIQRDFVQSDRKDVGSIPCLT